MKKLIAIICCVLMLTACTRTVYVEATPAPTDQPTAAPTATPEPTPTPYPYGKLSTMTAIEIVNALVSSGANLSKIEEYDASTDPNELLGRPHGYTQKVNFIYNEKYEGTVEIFVNVEDATARYDYIDAIGAQSSMLGYYLYQFDTVLFRVEYATPPTDAEALNAMLSEMDA